MKKKFFNLLSKILNIFSFKCVKCNGSMQFIRGDKFYSYYKCSKCGHKEFIENKSLYMTHG